MRYFIPKDKRHRAAFLQQEKQRFFLKCLTANTVIPNNIRISAKYGLLTLRKYGSFCKIRNRCIFTGRAGGVYRSFRLARSMICRESGFGRLSGVKKSSW
jgi:small subunit ribosomal protein S14